MDFIHDDFLLHSQAAKRLYHQYAENEPLLDFHSHLSPKDIAEDRRFQNLHEIWLEGDHYKWRAMRANGAEERFCTGDASPFEKFTAWAKTVPATLRNPLYHWTHLELKRYFGWNALLDENSAKPVWDKANELLQHGDLSARGILRKFGVKLLCTVDDPCDDLKHHQHIRETVTEFRVLPTFRPDKAFRVDQAGAFNAWIERLETASNINIVTLEDLLSALHRRHDFFDAQGCRLSDHGLNHCFAGSCSHERAETVFAKARGGSSATPEEMEQYGSFLLLYLAHLDAKKGWTKQLHLGARRNVNSKMLRQLGPDSGFDNIGDWPQIGSLCEFLDQLDRENALPKTIVYNLNPADNYAICTALGSFQEGPVAGKVQYGSGWWFLDQKEGIEWQLNALSHTGLLSNFIGMLTDSRSFMSFPRHEYFRRVLCNLLGTDVERGELPEDEALVGVMIRNICYRNAERYLDFGRGSGTIDSFPQKNG